MKAAAFISLAVAVAFVTAAPATAAGLGGRWRLRTTLPQFGISYSYDCELEEAGSALSGSCTDPGGNHFLVSGTVSGAAVQFSYLTDLGGVQARMRYSGALGPDGRLTGALETGELRGSFVAERE